MKSHSTYKKSKKLRTQQIFTLKTNKNTSQNYYYCKKKHTNKTNISRVYNNKKTARHNKVYPIV